MNKPGSFCEVFHFKIYFWSFMKINQIETIYKWLSPKHKKHYQEWIERKIAFNSQQPIKDHKLIQKGDLIFQISLFSNFQI